MRCTTSTTSVAAGMSFIGARCRRSRRGGTGRRRRGRRADARARAQRVVRGVHPDERGGCADLAGRWHELAADRGRRPISRGSGRILPTSSWQGCTLRGPFDAAERALDHAAASSRRLGGAVHRTALGDPDGPALWLPTSPPPGRRGRVHADAREPRTAVRFHGSTRGLRVEADAVERARAARDDGAVDEALRRAGVRIAAGSAR
jgi:hypothetical protein